MYIYLKYDLSFHYNGRINIPVKYMSELRVSQSNSLQETVFQLSPMKPCLVQEVYLPPNTINLYNKPTKIYI